MSDKEYITLLRKTLLQTLRYSYAWLADLDARCIAIIAADSTMAPDLRAEAKEYLAALKVHDLAPDGEVAESMIEAPID